MIEQLARQMLYPAPSFRVPSPPPPPLEEVRWQLSADSTVVGWSCRRPDAAPPGPVVLFLHGNGENLETMRLSGLFEELAQLGLDTLAVDYPSYGLSTGTPSEASLVAAAEAGLDWLADHYPQQPVLIFGWSLGAAVAAQTAARRSVAGVVLLSAWDDLQSLAGQHFPKWMVSSALSDRYDSVAAAREIRAPTLLVHGDLDSLIPVDCGRRLHAAFPEGTRFVEVSGAGHNDLFSHRQVWDELRTFVADLNPGSSE